jgi:ribosomal protein S8
MLNNLKQAIREKKLYFTVKSSNKNLELLYWLLMNNIITGFSRSSQRKKTFFVVFLNICSDFNSSVTSMTINSKKMSNQQNKIVSTEFIGSNFVLNKNTKKNNSILNIRKKTKSITTGLFR